MPDASFLKGKTAWITGGGSGIGLAGGLELARMGARIVISGRSHETLAAAEKAIAGLRSHHKREFSRSGGGWPLPFLRLLPLLASPILIGRPVRQPQGQETPCPVVDQHDRTP